VSKTLTTSPAEQLTVAIRADFLNLEVIASDDVDRPTAEVSGPEKVLDAIRAERTGSTWSLTWPKGAGGGRGTTIISGDNYSSMVIGRVSGRVIVNGVDVTALVNEAGGSAEPLRAVVRVPSGSVLDADLGSGEVATRGPLAAVRAKTMSADVSCDGETGPLEASTQSGDVTAERVGPVSASTMSGDVAVGGALGTVTASTMSGDVRVHALQNVSVNASTMSGDIRVTAAPGVRPQVSGRSMSGRVRTP
jgi:Putative adhesin